MEISRTSQYPALTNTGANLLELSTPTGKVKPGIRLLLGSARRVSDVRKRIRRVTKMDAQASLNVMTMNALDGLPVAPSTYAARHKSTGCPELDTALAELAQQPWLEILAADPGCLMPGGLDEDLLLLESMQSIEPKDFAVHSIGLYQYHRAKLSIRVRVLDFRTFQQWVSSLHLSIIPAREVHLSIEMHPMSRQTLLFFSLSFQYTSQRHVDFISTAILHSLKNIPL